MVVLSLFDGMSCGQIAFDKLGIKFDGVNDKYFASEIKQDGIDVAMYNYPNTIEIGDVTKVSYHDGILYTEKGEFNIGEVDYLIGGSPCQDFSSMNREQMGLEGVKSGLFFEYLRILKEVNPKYFLLENVKMSKKNVALLNGYMECTPIMINSKVITAQSRTRLYWTNINGIVPPQDKGIQLQDILEYGYTNVSKSKTLLESDSRPLRNELKMFHRYYKHGFTNLIFKDREHYENCVADYELNYSGMAAKDLKEVTPVYEGVRYLTQTELERLQTVPEGYTSILSRDKAAGILGDGWTVDVIAHILSFSMSQN